MCAWVATHGCLDISSLASLTWNTVPHSPNAGPTDHTLHNYMLSTVPPHHPVRCPTACSQCLPTPSITEHPQLHQCPLFLLSLPAPGGLALTYKMPCFSAVPHEWDEDKKRHLVFSLIPNLLLLDLIMLIILSTSHTRGEECHLTWPQMSHTLTLIPLLSLAGR